VNKGFLEAGEGLQPYLLVVKIRPSGAVSDPVAAPGKKDLNF
jgi:hypothetical protein